MCFLNLAKRLSEKQKEEIKINFLDNQSVEILSEKFNQKGFKTLALSGDNTEKERAEAIELLESDDKEKKLDYISQMELRLNNG